MRRSSAAVVVALSLSLTVLTGSVSSADDSRAPVQAPDSLQQTPGVAQVAEQALDQAEAVLDGTSPDTRLSPTIALRDLFVALPSLSGSDRKQAQDLLGRPTQGPNDPNGDGYTVAAKRTCSKKICLHWVPTTADAPPSRAWVDTTMDVMKRTWAREVDKLGYRRPLRDGGRGGNKKFDVYLKDVGADGYYGYCAPEQSKPGHRWLASGYCVLDDDFAKSQFGIPPMDSLRVTAAHEFFHAVQFAYDYGEDRWLMEASATWMEERVADKINDNRQYLRHGQVSQPAGSLDLFNPSGFDQYGNWAFFEYLSGRFGTGIVKKIWNRAATFNGAPDKYSIEAVKSALPSRTSWIEAFGTYAAANTIPARSYPEGRKWPVAPMASTHTLTTDAPRAGGNLRIDHLASRNIAFEPGKGLRARSTRLRVKVDGPSRKTGPAAYLLVHKKDGSVARKQIKLNADGEGRRTFRFSSRSVQKATLTLANASTRFRCWRQQTTYSCQGTPKDDDKRFGWTVRAFRR